MEQDSSSSQYQNTMKYISKNKYIKLTRKIFH